MTGEKFVDVNGIRTRYFDKGSGELLVLIHGGQIGSAEACCDASTWDLNFDYLARSFRVIALDSLGQGYTDNPKADDDYTMGGTVAHTYEFLKAMGLESANVVGHSRGGYVAARLALEHPELVRSCVAINSGTLAPGPSRTQYMMASAPKPALSRESQRWVFERYSYRKEHITEASLDAAVEIANLPKYREAVNKMENGGLKQSRFMRQLALEKEETLGWLVRGRLKTPTLLVWGYNDPTVELRRGEYLFELVANSTPVAELHVINGAGHFCYREQPETFNRVIASFVEKCAGST